MRIRHVYDDFSAGFLRIQTSWGPRVGNQQLLIMWALLIDGMIAEDNLFVPPIVSYAADVGYNYFGYNTNYNINFVTINIMIS